MENLSIKLNNIGVDVLRVINRLGGNELLYLSICQKFVQDQSFVLFRTSIINKDYKKALFYLHTLKGVAANLGFVQMEALCKALLEDFHQGDAESIQNDFRKLTKEYNSIISVLES